MNNKAVFQITVFVFLLGAAIFLGNLFLSFVLKKPIDEVPTIAKVVVHGITLGITFAVLKKYYIK